MPVSDLSAQTWNLFCNCVPGRVARLGELTRDLRSCTVGRSVYCGFLSGPFFSSGSDCGNKLVQPRIKLAGLLQERSTGMKTSAGLVSLGFVLVLLAGVTPAKAGDPFFRDGQLCQRASSGYVVCRDPRDHYTQGYVVGGRPHYDREWRPEDAYAYDRDCHRTRSGYVVCR